MDREETIAALVDERFGPRPIRPPGAHLPSPARETAERTEPAPARCTLIPGQDSECVCTNRPGCQAPETSGGA